jgi:hypothetical protein
VELARHGVKYGTRRESEGQFDLEPEPDLGVNSMWEENWNWTGFFLKIQSGF